MERLKPENYWSSYRESAIVRHPEGASRLNTVAALGEIE